MLATGVIVAVAAGVVGLGGVRGIPGLSKSFKPLTGLFASPLADVITFEVKKGNLPVTVVDKGILESSNNEDVYCQVEGQTTIISIVPEGKRVKKGDLVCELDSATLSDTLTNQVIATKGADASYQNAKLTREVAEIAVTEYEEGIFKQEHETARGEIALASSDRKRAEDRLIWSNNMFDKGYVSKGQNISEKLSLDRAVFSEEQAQTKLNVLEKFTKGKTIKELRSEVEKARSDELAKQATWDLEKTKEAKLRRQIVNCKLYAPSDGLVVYANDPNRFGGSNAPQIEEGATVRERQKIFSLPDISKMRVNTKIHESNIDRITPGLKARIKVESFAGETFTGTVQDVAPLPDPSSFFSSDIKVYTSHVAIENGNPGLRPGMSAQVEMLVTELENVMSVPVPAVLAYKGKDHVAVKTANGFEWKDVVLGISNDKLIEVKEGIKSGDLVVLSPMSLMTEEQKREAFGSVGKDATKKDWGGAPKGKGAPGADAKGKGAPGAEGKGDGAPADKAKAKGKGRRGGGPNPAMFQKFQNITPEDREKMKDASEEERAAIMKKAGFTDAELEQMKQMRANGGGFGGGPPGGGGGGPPGGGGGFGGGPPGGGGGGGGFGGNRQ